MTLDRGVGAAVVAAGALLLVATRRLPEALMGDPAGPSLLPTFLAWALIGLGALVAARPGPALPPGRRLWQGGWRLTAVSTLLVAYAVLLEPLGYLVATGAVLLALLALYNPGRWRVNAPVAGGFTLASWYLFHKLLGVFVPKGLLG